MMEPDDKNYENSHALHAAIRAIEEGDLSNLRVILDENPDLISARGIYSSCKPTLLHYVTGMPLRDQRVPQGSGMIAELLIRRGADIEAPAETGGTSETPLVWAVNRSATEVLDELLKAGANVDVLDDGGRFWTPLTDAIYFGTESIPERLVDAGARVTLRLAAGLGDLHALTKFFIEDALVSPDADFPDRNVTQQQLLDEGLLFAARTGKRPAAEWLLDKGADLNARRDIFGSAVTALHEAVAGDRPDMIQFLLSRGADPTIRDSLHDATPLQWAEHQRKLGLEALLRSAAQ